MTRDARRTSIEPGGREGQVLPDFPHRGAASARLALFRAMMRMKEETVWDSLEKCEEEAITIEGPNRGSFHEFIDRAPKAEVIGFFEEVINLLRARTIDDYHLVLSNRSGESGKRSSSSSSSSSSGWRIVIYHGGVARKDFSGPVQADRCMSCDLETKMQTGLTGTGSGGLAVGESMIYDDSMMRYWHDAKGRALFVVTPKRHVRALHELSRDEIYQLWSGSIKILDDMGCGLHDLKDMILNAGLDQNHEHLHLKVRVHSGAFERVRSGWSSKRRRLVDKLRDYADDLP